MTLLALAVPLDDYAYETGVHLRILRLLKGEVPRDLPQNIVDGDVMLSDVQTVSSCVPARVWARGQARLASLLVARGVDKSGIITGDGWPVVDESGAPLPVEAIGGARVAEPASAGTAPPAERTASPLAATAAPPGATPSPVIDVEALHVRLPDGAIVTIRGLLQMGRDFVEFTPVPLPSGVSTPVAPSGGASAGTPPSGVALPATGGDGDGSSDVWPFVVTGAIGFVAVVGVAAALRRARMRR